MVENTEANTLKARRAAAKSAGTPADPGGNVTGSEHPVVVGQGEPPRNYFMLADPREPRQVLEAGGGMFGGIVGDDFVTAPADAYEYILPPKCTTGTWRLRWTAGQHVPIEIFCRHYKAKNLKDALAALAEQQEEAAVEAAELAEKRQAQVDASRSTATPVTVEA